MSVLDWNDLVPHGVAVRQAQWEHRQMILRMREAGLSMRECGRRLGVTATTIKRHERVAAKELRMMQRGIYQNPVQEWLADPTDAKRLFMRIIRPLTPGTEHATR